MLNTQNKYVRSQIEMEMKVASNFNRNKRSKEKITHLFVHFIGS